MGLVECLNSDAKKGRLYGLTEDGKEVHNSLIEGGYFSQ